MKLRSPALLLLLPFAFLACDGKKSDQKKSASGASTPVQPAPSGSRWKIAELPARWKFTGFHEDKDLSGMAAWDDKHCLICTDEKHNIQPGLLDRAAGTVVAGEGFSLLPGVTGKAETDAEGVAVSPNEKCYYVTGSHGVAKKSGELQPSRCHVARIPVDPATGLPQPNAVQSGSLLPWVKQDPVLGSSVGRDLQHDGFNIEGLTWKDDKLWFGVRAPNINGSLFVIEAQPASLFTENPVAKLHRLPVGPGLGIREIAALKEGFLFIAGEANSDLGPDNEFRLYRWNPGKEPEFVGTLPAADGKAEGLFILEETADHVDALVVFDSAPGGGPRAYRLTRS